MIERCARENGSSSESASRKYWRISGRMYSKKPAVVAWLLVTVGFNTLYFPMLIMGYLGMPRRYYDYLPQYTTLHRISTVGSWILALGLLVMVVNLIRALRSGARAPMNPWGGKTLEWTVPSPPPLENFHEIPNVTAGPYDYSEYEQPAVETKR